MSEDVRGRDPTQMILPEPPTSNRYWRMVQGRMLLSRAARDYKKHVAQLALINRWPLIEKPAFVHVDIHWHRGRKSGDLDNRIKVVLDSIQGIAYENDSQITHIEATRHDSTIKREPYVVVLISESTF